MTNVTWNQVKTAVEDAYYGMTLYLSALSPKEDKQYTE